MSESNEQKKELSEQELKQIAGGKSVLVYYRCEKCGRPWNMVVPSSEEIPYCCGEQMKYYDYYIV